MEEISAGVSRILILTRQEFGFLARVRYLFGKVPLFSLELGEPMDPITAIFNFLSTTEGQKLVEPLTKIEADLVTIIADLIKKVHDNSVTPAPRGGA